MKLSHLRYIIEVAKTGSITRAAQNLYMGQPNLSKAIKDMETELGFTVFKRGSKGAVPTPRGAELILRATELIEKADSFEADYFGGKRKTERLSVAVCGAEWCIPVFERAASGLGQVSDLKLEFFRCDIERALELAGSGEVSFAVVRDHSSEGLLESRLSKSGLKGRKLCSGKRQIVTARINPIAQKEIIEEADLKKYTEVFVYGTSDSRHSKTAAVSDFGSGCRVLSEIGDSFMIASERDVGLIGRELCVKESSPPSNLTDWAVYSSTKKLSELETEAVKQLTMYNF